MRKKKEQKTKVKMVIAGPGSGKTTGLVREVLTQLPLLKPNRFMAVITYTNAATDKIRDKLQKEISIPHNLFIGTIHSFLNSFILSPYASLFGIIPSDVKYIDAITAKDKKEKNIIQKKIRDKGIITYEQIETISKVLVCGGKLKVQRGEVKIKQDTARKITEFLCKRLQAIFVDEYQDANTTQHAIFKRMIEVGKMDSFYCVGDPEQCIYAFSYGKKGVKKPNYEAIPIKELDKTIEVTKEENQLNYRATKNLVAFLNQFSPVQQQSQLSEDGEQVFFIQETNLENILNKFREKCSQCSSINDKYHLTFSLKRKNINWFNEMKVIDKDTCRTNRVLSEAMRYISGVVDKSLKSIREARGIQEIELRKVGMQVLKAIKDDPKVSSSVINNRICESLGSSLTNGIDSSSSSLEKLKTIFWRHTEDTKDYCATIHKCKGLEADAVLVVAETIDKLKQWFETDSSKRSSNTTDECRLGYVAFSRARKLLCIACLQDIGDFKECLLKLQIEIF